MRILILVYSEIKRDARVLRQIEWLKNENQITLLAFGDYNDDRVKFFPIVNKFTLFKKVIGAVLLKLRLFERYYWLLPTNQGAFRIIESNNLTSFDLVICNDIFPLPLAVKIKHQAKLVFDAHEYYPLEHDESSIWMFFFHAYTNYLCSYYAAQANLMFTVGKNIAQEYNRVFGLNPKVLMNLPSHKDTKAIINNDPSIRLVHHGIALEHRQLELMIDIVQALDNRFTLDLYLIKFNEKYFRKLKEKISASDKIRILEPIGFNEINAVLNNYDAGIYLIMNSKSFNYINCLPNKFFDFIQARLVVIIGPAKEMETIVKEYNCGYVTQDYNKSNIIKELNLLTKEQINNYKQASEIAAQELNSDLSKSIFLESIEELFR